MKYAVKELFYTLQGEGANAGRPAVFCRFAGCNLWSGREARQSRPPSVVSAIRIFSVPTDPAAASSVRPNCSPKPWLPPGHRMVCGCDDWSCAPAANRCCNSTRASSRPCITSALRWPSKPTERWLRLAVSTGFA